MAKRKKGVGAIEGTTEIIKDVVSLGVGVVGGSYVNKIGLKIPIFPQYAGPAANLAIGIALKKLVKNPMLDNVGNGMIAAAFLNVALGFGIGATHTNPTSYVNGTDEAMIAAYKARKAVNGSIINGSIINGLLDDNAVQQDTDLV